jgi:hypothetical protein
VAFNSHLGTAFSGENFEMLAVFCVTEDADLPYVAIMQHYLLPLITFSLQLFSLYKAKHQNTRK